MDNRTGTGAEPEDTPQNRAALDAALDKIVAETATASIALTLTPGRLRPWSSKVGGWPYLPRGADHPTGRHQTCSQPMCTGVHLLHLLAQINFAEMPAVPGFPASGLMQFYIDSWNYDYGCDLDDWTDNGFRIVFHLQVVEDGECGSPSTTVSSDGPVWGECGLTGALERQAVSSSDHRCGGLLSDALRQSLGTEALPSWAWEAVSARFDSTGHRIGGYPSFTQWDPREPGVLGGRDFSKHSTLLLQLDSDEAEGVDIVWGDGGVGNFFIEPERLAALDFSQVLYTWDCH